MSLCKLFDTKYLLQFKTFSLQFTIYKQGSLLVTVTVACTNVAHIHAKQHRSLNISYNDVLSKMVISFRTSLQKETRVLLRTDKFHAVIFFLVTEIPQCTLG